MRQLLRSVLSNDECAQLRALPPIAKHHTDQDGHGSDGFDKPLRIDWLATRLTATIQDVVATGVVDPMMKLYRLTVGDGVPPHCDVDFAGPGGTRARWSVLCYLSADHGGGETVFADDGASVHGHLGDVLVFEHSDRHEATPVVAGERFVLKTDIFVPWQNITIPMHWPVVTGFLQQ